MKLLRGMGRLAHGLIYTIAVLVILFAIVINVARIFLPKLDQHHAELQAWASKAIGMPLKIESMKSRWHGFEPVVRFNQVQVLSPKLHQPILRIKQVDIGVDLWDSLWKRTWLPGKLSIVGTNLKVVQTKDGLEINGIEVKHHENNNDVSFQTILFWLITKANVRVKDVNVDWTPIGANTKTIHFRNIRLLGESNFLHHRLAGLVDVASTRPTDFRFVVDMNDSDVASHHLNANIYLRAQHLLLSQWLDVLPLKESFKGYQLLSGESDLQAWGHWQKDHLTSVQAKVNAQHIQVLQVAQKQKLWMNELSGNVAWMKLSDGWQLTGDQLRINADNYQWPTNQFGIRDWQVKALDGSVSSRMLMSLGFLRLDDLNKLSLLLHQLPVNERKLLWYMKPTGILENIRVERAQDATGKTKYQFGTSFKHLSVLRWEKYPGVTNLDGSFLFKGNQGNVFINANSATIFIPEVFSHALFFNQLQSSMHWKTTDQGIELSAPRTVTNDGNVKTQTSVKLFIPKKGDPKIDLLGSLSVRDMSRIQKYLPDRGFSPHLTKWINSAILSATISGAKVLLHGRLKSFPFYDHRGKFEALGVYHNLKLRYNEKWPIVDDADGTFNFDDARLQVDAKTASTVGNPIRDFSAAIPDLHHANLFVTGYSNSDFAKIRNFLVASPLDIGKQMSVIYPTGPTKLNLSLKVPLGDHSKDKRPDEMMVDGDVSFARAKIHLPAWNLDLSNTTGNLHFTQNAVSAAGIQSSLLGSPLSINISTALESKHKPVVEISMGGQMEMQKVIQHFHLPVASFFQGSAYYRALLKLRSSSDLNLGDSFSLMSDLRGVTSTFPSSYAKTAKEVRALAVHMNFVSGQPLNVMFNYGAGPFSGMSGAMTFTSKNNTTDFQGGEIHFGRGVAKPQQLPGILISGTIPLFSWDKWFPAWKIFQAEQNTPEALKQAKQSGANAKLRFINVYFDRLQYQSYRFADVGLQLKPSKGGWVIGVNNQNISGQVFLPLKTNNRLKGQSQIVAHFSKIHVPKMLSKTNKKQDQALKDFDLSTLPPIDLTCADFQYDNKRYGSVVLTTAPILHGLQIAELNFKTAVSNLYITGQTQKWGVRYLTKLHGNLQVTDMGSFLKQMSATSMMGDGRGTTTFDLQWQGSIYNPDTATMQGNINIDLKNGRILHLGNKAENEMGIGRLLALFSLQSIPRRLALDFSDVTEKGFPFNHIQAYFDILNGLGTTKDAKIDGPLAWIQLDGQIDFVKKALDLKMQIIPNVTSTLPLVATVAGGPIAGAITWVANKIVGKQLSKAARTTYLLNGPWDKPTIKKFGSRG